MFDYSISSQLLIVARSKGRWVARLSLTLLNFLFSPCDSVSPVALSAIVLRLGMVSQRAIIFLFKLLLLPLTHWEARDWIGLTGNPTCPHRADWMMQSRGFAGPVPFR